MALLNPALFSQDTLEILHNAVVIAKSRHQDVLYLDAIILALIRSEKPKVRNILDYLVQHHRVDLAGLEAAILNLKRIPDRKGDLELRTPGGTLMVSRQAIIMFDVALKASDLSNEKTIDSDILLMVLAEHNSYIKEVLDTAKITLRVIGDHVGGKAVVVARAVATKAVGTGAVPGTKSSRLNPALLTPETNLIFEAAIVIVQEHSLDLLTPEAICLALIQSKNTSAELLLKSFKSLDLFWLENAVEDAVKTAKSNGGDLSYQTTTGKNIKLDRKLVIILDDALTLAGQKKHDQIGTDDLLITLIRSQSPIAKILKSNGLVDQNN